LATIFKNAQGWAILRVSVIRFIRAAAQNRQIELGRLDDAE
jgi:hypothetical protein